VSVGHVARAVEEAGIPTVVVMVRAFAHVAERMTLPRTVITAHPMGRPFGPVHDAIRQRLVLDAALDLAESAEGPGTVVEVEGPFRPSAS
jgi:hypothetical protein